MDVLSASTNLIQFLNEITFMLCEIIVVFLVGIEAVVAIPITLQGDEESGAADPLSASDTGWGNPVDVDTLIVVAENGAFLVQSRSQSLDLIGMILL